MDNQQSTTELAVRLAVPADITLIERLDSFSASYVKRVIVHPDFRGRGLAKHLMQHMINFAHDTYQLKAIDLHVWEKNHTAIRLYEEMGFELQHRELYYRLPLE